MSSCSSTTRLSVKRFSSCSQLEVSSGSDTNNLTWSDQSRYFFTFLCALIELRLIRIPWMRESKLGMSELFLFSGQPFAPDCVLLHLDLLGSSTVFFSTTRNTHRSRNRSFRNPGLLRDRQLEKQACRLPERHMYVTETFCSTLTFFCDRMWFFLHLGCSVLPGNRAFIQSPVLDVAVDSNVILASYSASATALIQKVLNSVPEKTD